LGDAAGNQIRFWKIRNAARLAERTRELLEPLGINRRSVPLRLFLRCVEEASMEDGEDIQDHWAALLASAANSAEPEAQPGFVDILRQLTGRDANLGYAPGAPKQR
jgi:hypothetical protein